MENYFWPENLIFTCDITLGSFCGLTTFSVMSFGFLATCVCGAKSESLHLDESEGGVKQKIILPSRFEQDVL
jgi:hypothetical protein